MYVTCNNFFFFAQYKIIYIIYENNKGVIPLMKLIISDLRNRI